MKVLTVFANPDSGSFCAAIRDRFIEGLLEVDHEVELADLFAERFNQVFHRSFILPMIVTGKNQ